MYVIMFFARSLDVLCFSKEKHCVGKNEAISGCSEEAYRVFRWFEGAVLIEEGFS